MSLNAPFPYFGGKRRAAPLVWSALGDPSGYVEPFAGSAAVLLARPRFEGRRVETLNDADGWLVNAWRAVQLSPDAVAGYAVGPVTEIDYHARLAWLQDRRGGDLVAWLEGDPEVHDAKAAGWWLYVLACGIGDPFERGPWRVVDGRLVDSRKLPHLGDAGQGVSRKLPHLGDAGQGVSRKLPHLGDAGQGVSRKLPHLGDAGQGVSRKLPHLGDAGQEALAAYLHRLSDRLRRVRITCGSWERVVTPSVVRAGAGGDGSRAIFLDPPYATSGDLYAETSDGIAEHVRAWCAKAPTDLRIVLCGYDDEHDSLGWECINGRAGGGAGYSKNADNGRRERLWLSPVCVRHSQGVLDFGASA
jgi:hypothetical protein